MIHKRILFAIHFFSILLLCIFMLSSCGPSKPNAVITQPTALPIPSDVIELSPLLGFYQSLVDQNTFNGVMSYLLKNTTFKVKIGGGNDAEIYKIGFDDDVLQDYHAKPGEFIEICYPKIDKKISVTPEYLVYHYYGKNDRYWSIIQLFSLSSGYKSSYYSLNDPGIWVRQWPALEGNDEYTRFFHLEDAVQFVAHYGDL